MIDGFVVENRKRVGLEPTTHRKEDQFQFSYDFRILQGVSKKGPGSPGTHYGGQSFWFFLDYFNRIRDLLNMKHRLGNSESHAM